MKYLLLLLLALPLFAADADLTVALSLNREPFLHSGFNVQMRVENHGPDAAADVHANLLLPGTGGGFSYEITRCARTGPALETLDCNLGTLAAGTSTTVLAGVYTPDAPVVYQAKVTTSSNETNPADNTASFAVDPITHGAPAGTNVTSTVTLTSSTPDYHPENNAAAFSGAFVEKSDLAVTASAATSLDNDGLLRYSYELTNRGIEDATAIRLHIAMHDGSTFISAEGATCHIAPDSLNMEADCTMADIAAGATKSFSFLARPIRTAGHFSSEFQARWGDPADALSKAVLLSTTIYRDFVVTTTDDSGPGSLRAAIVAANAFSVDNESPARVAFHFPPPAPAGGWYTIAPLTALPDVTGKEVVIDGTTQTALADSNPRGPEIELTGGRAFPADGLVLRGRNQVRGLAINGFSGNGILALADLTLTGNYLGTDPTGEVAVPNHDRGVRVAGSGVIEKNVISGNGRSGIFIESGPFTVTDNRIGVSATGAPLGNGASGVYYGDQSDFTRGWNCQLQGNVIAYNRDFGVAAVRADGVIVRDNAIHDNGGMSVDIGLDGPLPDGLAQVERPLITAAHYDAATGETRIAVHVDAREWHIGATKYTLYLFATPRLNRAGFAEGETFVTKVEVTAPSYSAEVSVPLDLRGQYITALTERFLSYYGEFSVTASSELSDGVRVP